jgi:RimJ/RimL family protein N-acetyltransferase
MAARVRLAAVSIADAPSINRWKNDPLIQSLSSDQPTHETLEETVARVTRWQTSNPHEIEHFMIRLTGSDEAIGFCHLAQINEHESSCKLGIVIGDPAHWGQGLGREALCLLMAHAFARGLTRLVAEVYANNARSIRLCESLGFALAASSAVPVPDASDINELVYVFLKP